MKSLIQSIRERYKTQSEAFPNMSAEASEMGATGVPGGNVTNQKDIVGDPAKQAIKKKKFDDAKAAANSTSSTPGAAEAQKKQGVAEGTYSKDVERAFPNGKASGVKTGASAPKGTSTMPKDKEVAKGKPVAEDVEIDDSEVDEIIISSPKEYDVVSEKNYDDYFKAKMKGRNLGSMSPEEKKKFFKDVDSGYKAKNEDVFLEAMMSSDLEDVKAAHRKAGNKISHETSSSRGGEAHHSFVVTQPNGKRTRHIYHGKSKRVETMSPAARSKESAEQDLDDKD